MATLLTINGHVSSWTKRRVRHGITHVQPHVFWLLVAFLLFSASVAHAQQRVAEVDIHGLLTSSTASFVTDQINEAWRDGYSGVILDIDTQSGSDDAAAAIKSAVLAHSSDLPIVAFVHDHAIGAGSLIPIACKTIVMTPGASMGNDSGSSAKMDFKATAEATGRNAAVATGFIAVDNPFPNLGVTAVGSPITLTPKQAQSVGYCDLVATDYPAVLTKMGLPNASIQPFHYDLWLAVAHWIAQPWATILLLAIGLALVLIEMATMHSWGLAGIIGGIMVLAIFAAHIAVGNGSWVGIIIILAGVVFMVFETHVLPSHGIAAIIGLALITIGMYFALGGAEHGGLYTLAGALMSTVGVTIGFFLYLPRSRVWQKMGQPLRQTAGEGYVASEDYTEFLGKTGKTVTLLRPSGTAEIDGVRLAVVSEGDFIAPDTRIQVILVQGSRIVVKQVG